MLVMQKEEVGKKVPVAMNPFALGERLRESVPSQMDPSRLGDHVNGAVSSVKEAVRQSPAITCPVLPDLLSMRKARLPCTKWVL